ncbi:MAG: hypothetical protein U0R44_04910 [Candidatus Micrarchaeia archaeon]
MGFWKRITSKLEKPAESPQVHPFRDRSPSTDPPRSVTQIEKQERDLIELLQGIHAHDTARMKRLLSGCSDVDFIAYEIKPLVFASYLGQLDTVMLLLEKGANIALPGRIPLFISEKSVCYSGHTREFTPIEAAELAGHDHVVAFLRKK